MFEYNLEKHTQICISELPDKYVRRIARDYNIKIFEKVIFVFCSDLSGVFVYDLKKRIGKEMVFEYPVLDKSYIGNQFFVTEWEDEYLLIPMFTKHMIRFNKKTKDYSVIYNWKEKLEQVLGKRGIFIKKIPYGDAIAYQKNIYINFHTNHGSVFGVFAGANIDLIEIIEPDISDECYGMLCDENGLWFQNISNLSNKIVLWDLKTANIAYEWILDTNSTVQGDVNYFRLKQRAWISKYKESIGIFEITGTVSVIDERTKRLTRIYTESACPQVVGCFSKSGKIVLLKSNKLILINVKEHIIEFINASITGAVKSFFNVIVNKNERVAEPQYVGEKIFMSLKT